MLRGKRMQRKPDIVLVRCDKVLHGQSAPEWWAGRSWCVPGVPGAPEVHGTWGHEEHVSTLHRDVWHKVGRSWK